MKWRTHKKKIAYQSKWTTLREDDVTKPDGTRGIYNLIESHPTVMVVPITENREVYLIKVWRYPTKKYSWELPGGRTDGASIIKTAKNELKEETGLIAKELKKVGTFYPLNGLSNEICNVFVARKLIQTDEDEKEDDAIVETSIFSLKKVNEMIKKGEVKDGQTIASLTLTRLYLDPKT